MKAQKPSSKRVRTLRKDRDVFLFIHLPGELRDMVYGHALRNPNGVLKVDGSGGIRGTTVLRDKKKVAYGLAYASRLIYYEASAILFRENKFWFGTRCNYSTTALCHFVRSLSARSMHALTDIKLEVQSVWTFPHPVALGGVSMKVAAMLWGNGDEHQNVATRPKFTLQLARCCDEVVETHFISMATIKRLRTFSAKKQSRWALYLKTMCEHDSAWSCRMPSTYWIYEHFSTWLKQYEEAGFDLAGRTAGA